MPTRYKNVYFHVDELGRDAITASALKKAFAERGINLVYGNRVYTKRVLEKFVFAFDIIILPRPMFLHDFKNMNRDMPPIVIVFTESVGRVVDENNDKFTLFSLLDTPYMEGDTRYVDKVASFLLWGESGKNRIDKYHPKIANKFHVIGHPRHDKRCISRKTKSISNAKVKIGLITRQPLLNDFLKRRPVEAVVASSSSLEVSYDYNNKVTGDHLLSQDNDPVDEIYMEAVDIKILLKLLLKLNEEGHEIHLKVHPREDRKLWVGFVKKYNLNVTLAHWRMPFSHWVQELDYVIGPASTSFYDCCVAGVQPICTRKINKKRDFHIDKFSEEYGALMKHIITPDSIDEIIDIVSKGNKNFELSDEIKRVLLNETNYPDSNNSINKLVEMCFDLKKEDKVSPVAKSVYIIGFHTYGYIIDNVTRAYRFITRRTEQGSTFLMTKKNRAYIDSLVD
jgi:hypothetical protein